MRQVEYVHQCPVVLCVLWTSKGCYAWGTVHLVQHSTFNMKFVDTQCNLWILCACCTYNVWSGGLILQPWGQAEQFHQCPRGTVCFMDKQRMLCMRTAHIHQSTIWWATFSLWILCVLVDLVLHIHEDEAKQTNNCLVSSGLEGVLFVHGGQHTPLVQQYTVGELHVIIKLVSVHTLRVCKLHP